MPKIIELTVELEVQKVSCPGVWLCQDGRVSLTVFALGTSYQTCMLPPVFPLMFKDVFYFRKRFQESCTLNNICCILKDETIYCELVQWSNDCRSGECTILAQYLGAINDVLFPPNMCSNDGVDLLMRRSKEFPGILSPKIEIATKVRIDEVWDQPCNMKTVKVTSCHCTDSDGSRQRQVCHSAQYHRNKCNKARQGDGNKRPPSVARSRSRSRSGGSRSCCSLQEPETNVVCECRTPTKSRLSLFRSFLPRRRQYNVYNVETRLGADWPSNDTGRVEEDRYTRSSTDSEHARKQMFPDEDRIQKMILESRYIEHAPIFEPKPKEREKHKHFRSKVTPCVCEICRRYHELFHTGNVKS
ncbi:spermatogenesis-associated protein 6 isoform X2 [Ostrinia furnacalis]|uniref:spermatogenesis-associated protein 6 isoform X2 n=1 Tax=Ostrinia furnacalis TaxID=93504 RepID=UPI0010408448|nr:spermatogenesis-associated protein 6 isoform X2 [Ostrinia furnacalis]